MARRDDVGHGLVLGLLALGGAALVAWVAWEGWSFYTTALSDRPHHVDFRDLRPAGRVGHGVGILGSAMVLLLLLYSVRKRWRPLARAGSLRYWLRYHILLGVLGPVLITLHTSFKIDGLVAVSYWSMVAVAASGVVGRYLYQQIPRNVLGETLAPGDVEADNEALMVELSERCQVDQRGQDALDRLALGPLEGKPAPAALLALPWLNLFLARRLQKWSREYARSDAGRAQVLARRWVLQTRRLHLFHLVRDLFHWWHVFHKPFAVIMILVMLVHVAVALALGYTWFGAVDG